MNKLAMLQSNVSNLNTKDQSFAQSLLDQSVVRVLSEKQMYWVNILADRATPSEIIIPTTISVTGIIELIRRNNNAKRPKIRFFIGETEFTLSVASSKAKFPGTINVNGGFWYGRIHQDGRYELSSRIEQSAHEPIIKALLEVAADPAKAAAEYGKKTGRCCFCALSLTDERSLNVGYGAICAKNYRLPWNCTELEKLVLVKELTPAQAFG